MSNHYKVKTNLTNSKYGKDNVHLCKVIRDEATGMQDIVEMTVRTELQGDLDSSWLEADNSVVVPTDTQKQTTFILAKQNPVSPPELFASIMAQHFVDTYSHIHLATVEITQRRWTRLNVDGKPHPHSFYRDGAEVRKVVVECHESKGIDIHSGIDHLLVLKTTGSGFYGFDTSDPYTVLKETSDRILSTEIATNWTWKRLATLEQVRSNASAFDAAWETARKITLDTFAKDNSASVQNTMYQMCQQILEAVPDVNSVEYTLPNKHYFDIDLSWHKGLKNTGKDAEVYAPQLGGPNGLIYCEVTRA